MGCLRSQTVLVWLVWSPDLDFMSFVFQRRPLFSTQTHSKALHLNPSVIRWAGIQLHFFCFGFSSVFWLRRLSSLTADATLGCCLPPCSVAAAERHTATQSLKTRLRWPRKTWQVYTTTSRRCCWNEILQMTPNWPFELDFKRIKIYFYFVSQELFVSTEELKHLCDYYFDGKGKAIRPIIVILMSRALNIHSNRDG